MLFSVVIPTHNRSLLIERAVGSVLAQTWSDFELIIVDDGSTDGTADLVGAIPDLRLRYLHQNNKGVSDARNAGARASHAQYLTFLDSDDEADPHWLAVFAELINESGCEVAGCNVTLLEPSGREVALPIVHDGMHFLAGSFCVDRSLFAAVGGYRKDLRYSENTELGLRLRAVQPHIAVSPRSLVRVNLRGERRSDTAKLAAAKVMISEHAEALGTGLASQWAVLAVAAARLGDYAEARRALLRAISTNPRRLRHYGQFALSLCRPLARRVWGRSQEMPPPPA